jgi:DDE superfamily endonuclease/IclR helix-turn-helix domain
MPTHRMLILAGLTHRELAVLERMLPRTGRRRGRPSTCPPRHRLLIACAALRTNLTLRELAAITGLSKSSVHRIVAALTPWLATLARPRVRLYRRETWIVDGTLIPTRDHAYAAKSKNYRWSCNAQILVRWRDRRVIATSAGGPGNRNDPVHYRGSAVEALCRHHRRVLADGGYRGVPGLRLPLFRNNRIVRDRAWRRHRRRRARVEHTLAHLKTWRILRDYRRRGRHLAHTVAAVAVLHNLKLDFRDNP